MGFEIMHHGDKVAENDEHYKYISTEIKQDQAPFGGKIYDDVIHESDGHTFKEHEHKVT